MPSSAELLSIAHAEAILELGRRGSGGQFDQRVMSQLFALGLIEVRNEDRALMLIASAAARRLRRLTGLQ